FFGGVCLRYVAYPDPEAVIDPKEAGLIPKDTAKIGAARAFAEVFEHGPKIELDHQLAYYARKHDEAKVQYELILSGAYL
ncbi:hypothetical protein BDN72DRAFT_727015, partial [Pluteus cervinus]